jgi:hypothetical protein
MIAFLKGNFCLFRRYHLKNKRNPYKRKINIGDPQKRKKAKMPALLAGIFKEKNRQMKSGTI